MCSKFGKIVTELYDRTNRPETLEVEPQEEEIDTDEKGTYILQGEVERAIMEMRNRKATEMMLCLEMCSSYWETVV